VITGIFRDGHPRLPLTLSTTDGSPEVEFIVLYRELLPWVKVQLVGKEGEKAK